MNETQRWITFIFFCIVSVAALILGIAALTETNELRDSACVTADFILDQPPFNTSTPITARFYFASFTAKYNFYYRFELDTQGTLVLPCMFVEVVGPLYGCDDPSRALQIPCGDANQGKQLLDIPNTWTLSDWHNWIYQFAHHIQRFRVDVTLLGYAGPPISLALNPGCVWVD